MSMQHAATIHLGDGLGDFMCFTSDVRHYRARGNRAEEADTDDTDRAGDAAEKKTTRRTPPSGESRKGSPGRKPSARPPGRAAR